MTCITRHILILFSLLAMLAFAAPASAAEVIPPSPNKHFTDYARVVDAVTAEKFEQQLADLERTSTNQLWVAIFPKLETDSSIEDYTNRVARAWEVGTREHNNGAILFMFLQDHRMRIEVGYGLGGALPDITCKHIEEDIAPHLKTNDYAGGIQVGINAMIAATKGEYKGTGKLQGQKKGGSIIVPIFITLVVLIFIISGIFGGRRGSVYSSSGSRSILPWLILSTMNSGRRGGGWGGGSGGGWSSGGGGGYSGGGGSFGGGGASGSW